MKTPVFLLLICLALFSARAENLYTSLLEVNDRWAFEKELPYELYQMPEAENHQIRTHLLWVHRILSERTTEGMSEDRRQNRVRLLQVLKKYALAEEYPNNLLHSERRPVFIAPNGNYCAVGHLIKESGRDDLARKISSNMNYEYLLNMQDEELAAWVAQSGFTAKELAWIQPAYPSVSDFKPMAEGMNGPVKAILPLANGEILAAGIFDSAGAMSAGSISQWKLGFAGYGWITFGQTGLQYEVLDMEEFNGGIVAAGNIYSADTSYVGSGVAFWDGTTWTGMGDFYIGALINTVFDIEIYNGELYAGGFFRSAIGNPEFFTNFAKWNGSQWVKADGSPDGRVRSLHVHDGKLILAGDFNAIDNDSYNHIAAYDGTGFSSLGGGVDVAVNAMASIGDTLFVGGPLLSPGLQDTLGLGFYYNNQWTKLDITPFGAQPNPSTEVMALQNTPYGLFIGGNMLHFPGVGNYAKNLIRYTNGYLAPYAILDSTVHSLSYDDASGNLYVGGDFTSAVGVTTDLNHITYVNIGKQFSVDENKKHISQIYPNPAKDLFTLKFDQAVDIQEVRLYDATGKLYPLNVEKHSEELYQVKVNGAPTGAYTLSIISAKGALEERIIIQ